MLRAPSALIRQEVRARWGRERGGECFSDASVVTLTKPIEDGRHFGSSQVSPTRGWLSSRSSGPQGAPKDSQTAFDHGFLSWITYLQ